MKNQEQRGREATLLRYYLAISEGDLDTACAILSSSVATMIRCSDCDRLAASITCRIKGWPVSDKRALPGRRVEAKRAGITPTISMFIKNISRNMVR